MDAPSPPPPLTDADPIVLRFRKTLTEARGTIARGFEGAFRLLEQPPRLPVRALPPRAPLASG